TLRFEIARYGTGIAEITGAGSKIIASNDGGLFSDPFAYAGGSVRIGGAYGVNGSLTITDGGVLEVRPGETVHTDTNSARIAVGAVAGSAGSIIVSGEGSAIVVEGPDNGINVGRAGTGFLSVIDQAEVTTQFIQFGRDVGSFGTGVVSGTGSKIDASGVDSGI